MERAQRGNAARLSALSPTDHLGTGSEDAVGDTVVAI